MRYFLRRAGFFVATLWAAITLNFLIPRLQPGDPAEVIVRKLVGRNASVDPAQLQSVRLMLGVSDKNLFQQYLDYLGAIVRGDFGVSFTYFPYKVTDVIAQAMPWTIVLVGVMIPSMSAPDPVTSLYVDPGGYCSLIAKFTRGRFGSLIRFW